MCAMELKANDIGVFIGEQTGGGGSVPADSLSITLPNTNLILYVSCKYFIFPLDKYNNINGVIPDYRITQSLKDYRSGDDTANDFFKTIYKR